MVRPGQYKHFKKGHIYEVLFCATHSETEEQLVVYRNNKGETWARPVSSFLSKVSIDGEAVPRFERMERDW